MEARPGEVRRRRGAERAHPDERRCRARRRRRIPVRSRDRQCVDRALPGAAHAEPLRLLGARHRQQHLLRRPRLHLRDCLRARRRSFRRPVRFHEQARPARRRGARQLGRAPAARLQRRRRPHGLLLPRPHPDLHRRRPSEELTGQGDRAVVCRHRHVPRVRELRRRADRKPGVHVPGHRRRSSVRAQESSARRPSLPVCSAATRRTTERSGPHAHRATTPHTSPPTTSPRCCGVDGATSSRVRRKRCTPTCRTPPPAARSTRR